MSESNNRALHCLSPVSIGTCAIPGDLYGSVSMHLYPTHRSKNLFFPLFFPLFFFKCVQNWLFLDTKKNVYIIMISSTLGIYITWKWGLMWQMNDQRLAALSRPPATPVAVCRQEAFRRAESVYACVLHQLLSPSTWVLRSLRDLPATLCAFQHTHSSALRGGVPVYII